MAVQPIPSEYHAVTPYLMVRGVPRLIEFLERTFDAVEVVRVTQPDGRIGHAQVRVGDSILMMGEAAGQWPEMTAMLYVYVADCDATYQKALAAGATSLMDPGDRLYGDRTATVQDGSGNQWVLATHKEDVPPEEIQRRHSEGET